MLRPSDVGSCSTFPETGSGVPTTAQQRLLNTSRNVALPEERISSPCSDPAGFRAQSQKTLILKREASALTQQEFGQNPQKTLTLKKRGRMELAVCHSTG